MKYKAVIFDLFGTLIDNFIRSEYEAVLAEMADILGVPWEKFIRMWFDTFRERNTGQFTTPQANIEFICEELNIKATPRQIEQAARKRLDYTVRSMKPRPGTLEALTALRSMGYRTGLISDCSGEIPIVWSKTQLAPFFDTTVFSCVAGVKKPDPRIYKMATDRLGVVPQECLYIGDGGSNELTGASQVGMYAVLLRDPAEPADAHFIDREEEWDGPVVSSVQEILNLLK